jgi:hypothetical protein
LTLKQTLDEIPEFARAGAAKCDAPGFLSTARERKGVQTGNI